MQPDVNVARLAREHGSNDNLLFNRSHRHKREKLLRSDSQTAEQLLVSIVSSHCTSPPDNAIIVMLSSPMRREVQRRRWDCRRFS